MSNGNQGARPTLSLDPATIELIEKVVYDEARGEGVEGRNAVRAVIYNRLAANRRDFGGNTVRGVLNARNQFQGVWEKGRGDAANLTLPEDARDTYIQEHLQFLQSGEDPTNGATFFLNKGIARRPFNVNQTGIRIGQHEFFDNYNGNRVEVPQYEVALRGFQQDLSQAALQQSSQAVRNVAQQNAQRNEPSGLRPFTGSLAQQTEGLGTSSVRGPVINAPTVGQQTALRPFRGQIASGSKVPAFAHGGALKKIELIESEDSMSCGMMKPDMFDMVVGTDPVSGNPIPPGSNADNVRDDIPAVLSDGEYVVPADVVRYHGLKTFMEMRAEAKMGLMAMLMEGQIRPISEEGEDEGAPTEEEEPDSEDAEGSDVSTEEDSAEEGDEEFSEGEYETPEGNVVATPEVETEIMTMASDEEDPEYGKDLYGDEEVIKIFMMSPQAFKRG